MRPIVCLIVACMTLQISSLRAQGLMTNCWAQSGGLTWVIPHGHHSAEFCRKLAIACTGDPRPMVWHSTNARLVIAPIYPNPPLKTCMLSSLPEQKAAHPSRPPSGNLPQPPPKAAPRPASTRPTYNAETYRHPLDLNNDRYVDGVENQAKERYLRRDPNAKPSRSPSRASVDNAPYDWRRGAELAGRNLAQCENGLLYHRCHASCRAKSKKQNQYLGTCDRDCVCATCGIVQPAIINNPQYLCPGAKPARRF